MDRRFRRRSERADAAATYFARSEAIRKLNQELPAKVKAVYQEHGHFVTLRRDLRESAPELATAMGEGFRGGREARFAGLEFWDASVKADGLVDRLERVRSRFAAKYGGGTTAENHRNKLQLAELAAIETQVRDLNGWLERARLFVVPTNFRPPCRRLVFAM
jgi:hypothetical protein